MLKAHSWRTACLVIALTVIGGLPLPAFGGDWLPFSGHLDEVIGPAGTGDGQCLPAGCQVTSSATGQATHLGQFTRLACVVVHPDGSVEGTIEFTAANGDTLCADINAGPTIGGIGHGTYTFTGGTGRFSDASGGAYFVGVFAFPHIAVDFGGIIQY